MSESVGGGCQPAFISMQVVMQSLFDVGAVQSTHELQGEI